MFSYLIELPLGLNFFYEMCLELWSVGVSHLLSVFLRFVCIAECNGVHLWLNLCLQNH